MIVLLRLIGGLGVFLFGMKHMSDAIRRSAGVGLRRALDRVTGSSLLAIGTGLVTTALIQSSSATTVVLVSLVNARLVNLSQAIGVIMGANIGTTVTSWIVSFFGFQMEIAGFALPAIAISLPLRFSKRERLREVAGILLGFGLLFLGLDAMKSAVSGVRESAAVLRVISGLTGYGPLSTLIFLLLGAALTVAVQSSSAALTITITFAYNGWIPFDIAAAIVLGENIGTTVTAYLASLEMNTAAKRVARAHMVFNVIGVLWALALLRPLLLLVDVLIPGSTTLPGAMPYHISAFHTLFNVLNTLLLAWFIPGIERLVVRFAPDRETDAADIEYRIPHIRGSGGGGVEANLINARAEVGRMSRLVNQMMLDVMNAADAEQDELAAIERRLSQNEAFVDRMQDELSVYLAECATKGVTEPQAFEVRSLLRVINELESISDSCHRTAALYLRKRAKGMEFHQNASDEINEYAMGVTDFLRYNTDFLNNLLEEQEIEVAARMEQAANERQRKLAKVSRKAMARGGDIRAELLYLDIIREMDHIGGYCLNIAQALAPPTPSAPPAPEDEAGE